MVERNLVSSLWPLVLRADSTASHGVDRSIRLVTWLRPLGLLLVTIAAVVTPLGLYDAVEPGRRVVQAKMQYIPDLGPFGYGTPPRPAEGFSRKCGDFGPLQCPGTTYVIEYGYVNTTDDGDVTVGNGTVPNNDHDVRIPKVLGELYQSGLATQKPSVSSFFDIQNRQWGWTKEKSVNFEKPYPVEGYQTLTSVILNDAIEVFEGLVVDTRSGGVGFRNHTVPMDVGLGAEWSEDILWIQPETECVDLNVSVQFKAPWGSLSQFELVNMTLVDNGGWSDSFVPKYPILNISDGQKDPQLRNRAYKAAWNINAYSMLVMNLTRPSPNAFGYMKSKLGDRYSTTEDLTHGALLNGIYATNLFSYFMDPDGYVSNYSLADAPGANYSNPFELDLTNYTSISTICSGAGGMDHTNMSNIHVECGLVFGAAQRLDGPQSLVFEPMAWYEQPVYVCASTNKASIKRVHFRYNATLEDGLTRSQGPNLRQLSVESVEPISYPDNKSMPLWGVETVPFFLHELTQLWGLVSPELEHSVNLTTKRAEHLYLPGYGGTLSTSILSYQYLPGTTGPSKIISGLYDTAAGGSPQAGMIDYSGQSSVAMLKRWREYSQNETSVSTIMNLIWADLAANMLVGTRSWNTKSNVPSNLQKRDEGLADGEDALVPVTIFERQVRYHWYYAIPAVLSLALVALICLSAFLLLIFGNGRPSRIDHYLKNLSAGRLLGAAHYPAEPKEAPTREWIARVGKKQSDLHMYGFAHGAPSLSTPFFGDHTAYDGKSSEAVNMQPINRGSVPKGGHAKVNTYDQPGDEIFGHAK